MKYKLDFEYMNALLEMVQYNEAFEFLPLAVSLCWCLNRLEHCLKMHFKQDTGNSSRNTKSGYNYNQVFNMMNVFFGEVN